MPTANKSSFTPLMTLYLTDNTSPDDVAAAQEAGIVAYKLYPAGATTNSGVTSSPFADSLNGCEMRAAGEQLWQAAWARAGSRPGLLQLAHVSTLLLPLPQLLVCMPQTLA